ncbi:MAG: extracellular solute-binding protein [Thermomicrobiales bacterium]
MSTRYLQELIAAWQDGTLSRRDFVRQALAAGVSAGLVSATLAGRQSVSAQDPTPTPFPPQTFNEGASVKLRYWTILGSVDGIIMNDLVRKFSEENTDIAVESLQGLTDFIPKMQSAAISGTAPDVALVRHTYVGPFASRQMLTVLEPAELEQTGIRAEDFDPTVWGFTTYEDQQYTVPLDIHCHAMLHNTRILSEAGLGVPTTLEEWENVVTTIGHDDNLGYQTFALGAGAQEFMTWYWYGIQRQHGGEMLSEDGTQAAFNTAEGVEAVNWMKRMQDAGNPQNSPMVDLARTGKVATWPDGPWITTLFFNPERAPNAEENDVAVLPQRDPNAPATWGQSHQFALPRQGDEDEERRAASLRFVKWMAEHAVDWAQAGQIPANNAARDEALGLEENVYMQKLNVWAEQLPYVAYMRSVPLLLEVMPRIAANVEGAILGEWSVEDGLKQAEDEVNQILGR